MSIVFSSRRTICSSPLDRNGGVAVSEAPHTEKGSNAPQEPKDSALLLLHDALRVDTPEALKHKEKVAAENCTAEPKNTHRADSPLRREQPQPSQDTTPEGGGAGVAKAEASDPVDTNIPKARKTPSARTDGGDRIGTTIEAKANEPLPPTKSGGGDGNGPPHTFHKRTPPEDFRRTLRVSMRAIYRNLVFVLVLTLTPTQIKMKQCTSLHYRLTTKKLLTMVSR